MKFQDLSISFYWFFHRLPYIIWKQIWLLPVSLLIITLLAIADFTHKHLTAYEILAAIILGWFWYNTLGLFYYYFTDRAKCKRLFINVCRSIGHPIRMFDRTFSEKALRQTWWIAGGLIFLLFISVVIGKYTHLVGMEVVDKENEMPWILKIYMILIDPGQVASLQGINSQITGVVITTMGMIFITGITISVFSNMLERRIEKFRNGEICYKHYFHIVIIGYDDMTLSLIQQLCQSEEYHDADILIMSQDDINKARVRIKSVINKVDENRIYFFHGRKYANEDLEKLNINYALRLFIVGEYGELNRDSANLESLQIIVSLLKKKKNANQYYAKIPTLVVFEYQTTFVAFQTTDLSKDWKEFIIFRPFNFYENWAKKLLYTLPQFCVDTKAILPESTTEISYPSLDRRRVYADSDEYVHFVIFSMSRMGVALGTLAAQMCHFPNYISKKKKTIITFITPEADTEMQFFKGRYQHFFDIATSLYYDFSDDNNMPDYLGQVVCQDDKRDFLDIQFEFIKGKAEQANIRNLLTKWAEEDSQRKQILSIAICQKESSQNLAIGLFLPNAIFEYKIPVFIRIKTTGILVNMLNCGSQSSKYSCLYPFGMIANCYDLDEEDIKMAKLFNMYYSEKKLSKDILDDSWNKLPISHQWSNLYLVYSLLFKLNSLKPDEEGFACMAQTEHNRWNTEKLLLGFRMLDQKEREVHDAIEQTLNKLLQDRNLTYDDIPNIKEQLQKKGIVTNEEDIRKQEIVSQYDKLISIRNDYKAKFAHYAIAPFEKLDEKTKSYDYTLTRNIPELILTLDRLKNNEEI
ncbi:MAG: hypothetical protein IJG07_07285 [Prevotella sp.]|nr:hypothetical protein [Prevotella sp.]